jgi:LacI family transcriptional regulator
MVTIADVAARAGVGTGTVSRVLNDSPKVTPETRERVLEAIDALDFRPSSSARALSRGRSQTLGVIVPFFTHASAVERLRGVVAALEGSRHDLVLFSVALPAHRDEHFAALRGRDRADGLLVMTLPPSPADMVRLAQAEVPVVLVDTRGEGVPMVVTDDVAGGRIATRHLFDLGHRRIAFIGDDREDGFGFTASPKREQGYEEVLAEAGITYDPGLVRHGYHERDVAQRLAGELLTLDDPPTAVFASSDIQATGTIAAARALGLRVPEDLSVVGFDDIELAAYVGLTTVRQPLFDSGYLGTKLLLSALQDEETTLVEEVHDLPLELVERSTTAPPPPKGTGRG